MMKFVFFFLLSMPLMAQESVTCETSTKAQNQIAVCNLDIIISGVTYTHGTASWERAVDIIYAEDSQVLAEMSKTLRVPNDSCSLYFKIGDVTHYMCDEGLFIIRDSKLSSITGKEWNEIIAEVLKHREEMCSRY